MSRTINSTAMVKGPLALLVLVAAAGVAAQAGTPSSGSARCEIRVTNSSDFKKLEGFVHAGAPLSGTYQLVITASGGAGSSDIEQSGSFTAVEGLPASLGTVMLGGSGGRYSAKLNVKWNGGGTSCTRNFGGYL